MDLRPLRSEDLDDLKTDADGNLYWKGRQIRTGGWTNADRIALGAAIVAVLTLLAGLAKDYEDILANFGPSKIDASASPPPEKPASPTPPSRPPATSP
jgi:hypothetical protein